MRWPHTAEFQQYQEGASDGMGGYKEGSWQTLFTTEAHFQPISGYTRIVAQQQESPVTTKLYYPYSDTAIKPGARVLWVERDKTLTTKSDPIDQGGAGEDLVVECIE